MNSPTQEREIDLFGFAMLLGEEKRIIFGIPISLMLITAVISLLMTPKFTATTVVMAPQQQQSPASAMADQLGGPLASLAMSAMGGKGSTEVYVAFLKSESVRNRLIEQFNLQERYKKETLGETRKTLDQVIGITSEKPTGMISISVTDPDPKFAAELANAHIPAVQALMARLSLTDAQQRRKFFEAQADKVSEKAFRDVRVQELILAGLIRQYEVASIDEAKDGPLLQQVDIATPPEKKSSPKRVMMVLIAGFIGLFLGIVAAAAKRVFQRLVADPVQATQLRRLKAIWSLGNP